MLPIISEGAVEWHTEDGGRAAIGEMELEDGMIIRIQSWDTSLLHSTVADLHGRKLRVTIEVIDQL